MIRKVFEFIRDRHALLYKGFLFLSGLLVLVWIYPRGSAFRYNIDGLNGKPWPYEGVIAPFDFAVSKPVAEIEQEKEDLRREFTPYYRVDSTITEDAQQEIAKSINDLPSSSRVKILTELDKIYTKGIRTFSSNSGKGPGDKVLLVKGAVAEEILLGTFPTPSEVDTLLRKRIPEDVYGEWKSADVIVRANVLYDSALTRKLLQQALSNVAVARGAVTKGELIVNRGDVIDDDTYQKLVSLQAEYELKSGETAGGWTLLGGQLIVVGFVLFLLFQFLRLFRRELLASDSRLLFLLLIVVLTTTMSFVPNYFQNIPLYALPFCILPIIMRAFFDARLALFVHLIIMLIVSLHVSGDRFHFLFIQVLTGITALFSIVNMRHRSQLFFSVLIIIAVYSALHIGLHAVAEGELIVLQTQDFVNYTISAVLVLLAYPLIFVFEKIFGFVSDVTLLELSDTNNPLLRELAEKAPGTFQHSMQVANLAEEAIRRIGGNALLVRTGALYHDIGKADMPVYFIENQTGGINPHEELTFEESASIIISHVIRGVEKAKAGKLPDIVIDFIRTHHGTTNTAYFLTLYKKNNPQDFVDEELFRYPGPVPYSKETAVLMMADAVEASSRSLKNHDGESIDQLVEKIIDDQADRHQFDNSNITLKDITAIKKIFKKKLRSIYHVRVEYPK